MAMLHLLTLPPELRDNILELVIASRRPTPSTLAEIEARAQPRPEVSNRKSIRTLYLPDQDESECTANSLLLVNRQLHAETKEVLWRTGIKYSLDVKFVHEMILLTCWTNISIPAKRADRVYVKIQTVGTSPYPLEIPEKLQGKRTRWWNLRHLYEPLLTVVMERFGSGLKPLLRCEDIFIIGSLELDFVDPDDRSLLAAPEDASKGGCGPSAVTGTDHDLKGLRRPEWLAYEAREGIEDRLLPTHDSQSRLDRKLTQQTGRILLRVNGRLLHVFDVTQVLANVRMEGCNLQLEYEWEEWKDGKEHVMQQRRQNGLAAVEPAVGEEEWAELEARRNQGRCYCIACSMSHRPNEYYSTTA